MTKPNKCCKFCFHFEPTVVNIYGYFGEDNIITPCKYTDENYDYIKRCDRFKWNEELRKLIDKK